LFLDTLCYLRWRLLLIYPPVGALFALNICPC